MRVSARPARSAAPTQRSSSSRSMVGRSAEKFKLTQSTNNKQLKTQSSQSVSLLRQNASSISSTRLFSFPEAKSSFSVKSEKGIFLKTQSHLPTLSKSKFHSRSFVLQEARGPTIEGEVKSTESKPEEPVVKIEETEKVVGPAATRDFQAETKKLLDIVARSLYTDQEVFVRELISNSSDALEKLRHLQVSSKKIVDSYLPMEIQISCDQSSNLLMIQDFGIGMTKEELIENLGTIAHSGSLKYIKGLEKEGKGDGDKQIDASSIIGQFGVGFYSVFMVADKVKVYSKSAAEGSKGHLWSSDGSGTYEIAEADNVSRGTKIIIQLKEITKQFSEKIVIETIIKKYSNFVGFDIKVNGSKINTVKPLWLLPKNSVTEADHKEFYQFISRNYDSPMYTLHYHTDSPIHIRGLFYVPEQHTEKYGIGKMDPGVNLFSRKVLIQAKARGLLPEWLRFVKGVVDSEEIPLNISREHLQDSALIQRVGNVLVKRILRYLSEQMKEDREKYEIFWKEYNEFLRQGILTDFKWKAEIAKLFLCETSKTGENKLCSLDDYISRMQEGQKQIYYFCVPHRGIATISPYYETFKKKDIEVLFLYTSLDDFVMKSLGEYKGFSLQTIESAQIDHKDKSEDIDEKDDKMSSDEIKDMLKWMKDTLADKVYTVKETARVMNVPCIVVDYESASLRRMMKMVDPNRAPVLPKQNLDVNPRHPIIVKLNTIKDTNPDFAKQVLEQIYDNALISAGLVDDSRHMIARLNNIIERSIDATTTTK